MDDFDFMQFVDKTEDEIYDMLEDGFAGYNSYDISLVLVDMGLIKDPYDLIIMLGREIAKVIEGKIMVEEPQDHIEKR